MSATENLKNLVKTFRKTHTCPCTYVYIKNRSSKQRFHLFFLYLILKIKCYFGDWEFLDKKKKRERESFLVPEELIYSLEILLPGFEKENMFETLLSINSNT